MKLSPFQHLFLCLRVYIGMYTSKGRLASGPDDTCDLFADFIQQTYADDVWVPSEPGTGHCG
jgi:hypothetical protein